MLTLSKKQETTTLTIILEGRLDTTSAPQLEETIRTSSGGISTLILDFSKLEYISSAGLRVLLCTQKVMNKQGRMILRQVNQDVKDILDMTGFSDILTIEE